MSDAILILKHAFNILETSSDNREKLQAMELFKDTHLVKLELLSNATTIDSALTTSEASNSFKTNITRTLSIQFGKDAKVIDIIGSKSTVQ